MPPIVSKTLQTRFHPVVQKWFESKFKLPTEIQEKAWELIAAGEHSLISAATGSGKTLAAFLWAISELASGEWLRDRIAISVEEWNQLLERIEWIPKTVDRGSDWSPNFELESIGGYVFLREESDRVESLFSEVPDPDLFTECLSYYGPVSVSQLRDVFATEFRYRQALSFSIDV